MTHDLNPFALFTGTPASPLWLAPADEEDDDLDDDDDDLDDDEDWDDEDDEEDEM